MRCRECRDERSCGIRIVMKEVRDATARIMDSTSLEDMLKRVEAVVTGNESLSFSI
jgi:DNA-binding IscR family transcriptional regulator